MKKSKLLSNALCLICAAVFAVGMTACENGESAGGGAHSHVWGEWTVSTTDAPTATAAGKATRACTGTGDCDAAATDKEYTLPDLTSADYSKTADTATCTLGGESTYTYNKDGVNVSFDVATSAKGHTEEVLQAEDATCTEDGLTAGKKCSVCGETLVAQDTVTAHGHTEADLDDVDATCTEAGSVGGKECSVCHTVLEAPEVIAAKGHTIDTSETAELTVDETAKTVTVACTECDEPVVYEYDNAVLNAAGAVGSPSALSYGVNYVSQSTKNPYLSYTFTEAGTYTISWVSLNNSSFNLNPATFSTPSEGFISTGKEFKKANVPESLVIEGYARGDLQYYIDNVATTAHAGDYVRLTKANFQSSQTYISFNNFVPVKLTFTVTEEMAAAETVFKFRNVTDDVGGCFLVKIEKEPTAQA